MTNRKAVERIGELLRQNANLVAMVKVLSAIIDLQELPRALTLEDYGRLHSGQQVRCDPQILQALGISVQKPRGKGRKRQRDGSTDAASRP